MQAGTGRRALHTAQLVKRPSGGVRTAPEGEPPRPATRTPPSEAVDPAFAWAVRERHRL
ncbi:MAG: hypothetical protein M3P70_05615 [Actinomycetota bacterium]|nr:hypothetical protein [Actinomycetota bacterium]